MKKTINILIIVFLSLQVACRGKQEKVVLTKEKAKDMIEKQIKFINHSPIIYFSSMQETQFDTIFTGHINGYDIRGFYKKVSRGDTLKEAYNERIFIQDGKIFHK